MSMSDSLKQRLDSIINGEKIVLFMKGDRNGPQCGFSARVVGVLEGLTDNYKTIDVLSDPDIRNGIKEYSEWPTIPQLYIDGDFIGGCDVIEQLSKTGDLGKLIGEEEALSVPTIVITDSAAESIREVCLQHPDLNVHLNITDDWVHEFNLAPNSGQVIVVENNGIELLLNRSTAKKTDGLRIDMEVTPEGSVFSITNPNAPPMVSQMSVHELKRLQESGDIFYLFDVREQSERDIAVIAGSRLLSEENVKFIDTLDRNSIMIFQCHTGVRSQSAAEYFRDQGFTRVYNLSGGIDAWSVEIDVEVARY